MGKPKMGKGGNFLGKILFCFILYFNSPLVASVGFSIKNIA